MSKNTMIMVLASDNLLPIYSHTRYKLTKLLKRKAFLDKKGRLLAGVVVKGQIFS